VNIVRRIGGVSCFSFDEKDQARIHFVAPV